MAATPPSPRPVRNRWDDLLESSVVGSFSSLGYKLRSRTWDDIDMSTVAGKTVVTNTTTPADVEAFRQRGIRYLVTCTPRLEGRSFGTNMMEAALVAAAGKERVLSPAELQEMLVQLNFQPTIQQLNP